MSCMAYATFSEIRGHGAIRRIPLLRHHHYRPGIFNIQDPRKIALKFSPQVFAIPPQGDSADRSRRGSLAFGLNRSQG